MAVSVFAIIMTLSVKVFTDVFMGSRRVDVSRILFEESKIVMEKIVKEIRRGTVDYEEYWSWNNVSAMDYSENYGDYALQFYRDPSGNVPAVKSREDENIGINARGNTALNDHLPEELYLITSDGFEKTIIKKVQNGTEFRLAMLKLIGADDNGDAIPDVWTPAPDFLNGGSAVFQEIQPDTIKITGLKFIVSPLEDPRKAFATFTNDVQIQPHVTILLTTELAGTEERNGIRVAPGIKGPAPSITLQTTVSARAQNQVMSLP